MNEAKLLLWGKGDVDEWNSHKCHQRLVKSFGQIGRPEMVLLEYSNFLDQLLYKSCGTETISSHMSKGEMRELNRGVFENPSRLPLWLYLVRIKSYTKTREYDEALTNTRLLQTRGACKIGLGAALPQLKEASAGEESWHSPQTLSKPAQKASCTHT